MNKVFGKVKIEILYLRSLIKDRSPLKYFYNYFKNRYFGFFLLRRMPTYKFNPDAGFELHILTQKDGLWMLYWSIRSFLFFSGLCPKIIIHDDGTIDSKTARLFESKFSNLTVILKERADSLINNNPAIQKNIKEYRMKKPFPLMELTDIYLLAESENIILMDSDIIFYNKPQEIIDFIQNRSRYDAIATFFSKGSPLYLDEDYIKKYDLLKKGAANLISGIIIYKKHALPMIKFLEYFEHTLDPENPFIEQAGWGSLICQTNFTWFSSDRYPVKGFSEGKTVAKHFTTPRRYQLYAYGIDMVRKRILN